MIKDVRELENVLESKKQVLSDVFAHNLLNSEGVRTLEAYTNILKLTPFYGDLEELYENERLKGMLENYSDCSQIRHLAHFFQKLTK